MITNAEIKKKWNIFYAFAVSKGHASIADDFAQEAVMEWLKNPERSTEHIFIDFLRKQYGRIYKESNNTKGDARARARIRTANIDDCLAKDIPAQPETEEEREIDWRSCISLDEREARICDAILDDEIPAKDVAPLYDLSPSRISQVMRVVKKKITSIYILKEVYSDYKEDPSKSVLLVNWIKL